MFSNVLDSRRNSAALSDLVECIDLLIKEQRKLCHEVGNSTLSSTRLEQRLVVARRYLMALVRHKPQETKEIPMAPKPAVKLQKMYSIAQQYNIAIKLR